MVKKIEGEDVKKSRFKGFLFVIVVPLVSAGALALVVLSLLGINVFESAKGLGSKLPVISQYVNGDDSSTAKEEEQKVISLEAEIKNKEAKLEQLQSQLKNKDSEIERLNLEKKQLEEQTEELTAIQTENKRAFKDIVNTYETISGKKAAPIITELKDEEALKILTNIKAENLADILESMSPQEAAKYTEMLTNESN
ncbi:MotE family protein [Mesobacillus foraminis]|uniref:MotE family protein n=1 Tax=Mesobacillus foraminis TaxID=279826 RepID=UPI000EF502ED|nr:hypothetical protein [Mesobacillus foraminis]